MDPITISAMIGGIVTFLGGKLAKDESVNSFLADFSEASVDWIRPLFLEEDGIEKEIIQKLKAKPESPAKKKAVEAAIESALEDNPAAKVLIREMFDRISKTETGEGIVNTIINSTQVITGKVTGNITQTYNEKN